MVVYLVDCWCALLACVVNNMDPDQIASRVQRSERGSLCLLHVAGVYWDVLEYIDGPSDHVVFWGTFMV